jgi:hypothetical protein
MRPARCRSHRRSCSEAEWLRITDEAEEHDGLTIRLLRPASGEATPAVLFLTRRLPAAGLRASRTGRTGYKEDRDVSRAAFRSKIRLSLDGQVANVGTNAADVSLRFYTSPAISAFKLRQFFPDWDLFEAR